MWFRIFSLVMLSSAYTEACPRLCVCSDTLQVVCDSGTLTKIPTLAIPSSTLDLSLAGNQLKLLEKFSFSKFVNLKKVNLDKNQITEIEPNAFYGMENLDEISLQHNPLAILTSNSFAGLTNIRNIYLGYNKIAEIEGEVFVNSQQIKTLSLRGNPLEIIRPYAFKDLMTVEVLYLPEGIRRIEADAFYGLYNVSQLEFRGLEVNILPKYTFRGLSNVRSLTIRDSDIGIMDGESFYNMTDVGSIVIEDCNIEKFHPGVFTGLSGVKELSVVGNRIVYFYPNALDEYTKSEIPNLRVQNNWVPCDCRVRWLRENSIILPSIANDNLCYTPEIYNNSRASSVELVNLKECHPATFRENSASWFQPIVPQIMVIASLIIVVRAYKFT